MSNLFNPSGTPFSKFLELAVSVIPQRKIGTREMLRPAFGSLPMPLSLGWQPNPLDPDYPPDGLVKGLLISDIASGATRSVEAPWMHTLYNKTWEERPTGVTMIQLKEAHFTARFGWRHRSLIAALFIQIALAIYGIVAHQVREGCLVFLGIFIQICEGLYVSKFPKYQPPRLVKKARFYALHMGMTTNHILILVHDPGTRDEKSFIKAFPDLRHVNLEDAAVPLIKRYPNAQRRWVRLGAFSLQSAGWIYRAACVLTASSGYLLPVVMLFGSVVKECLSLFPERNLPKSSTPIFLDTITDRPSLLDRLLATCQATGSVSVGFTESILPDPTGQHIDYNHIRNTLENGSIATGIHPNHQTRDSVHEAASKRRTSQVGTIYRVVSQSHFQILTNMVR